MDRQWIVGWNGLTYSLQKATAFTLESDISSVKLERVAEIRHHFLIAHLAVIHLRVMVQTCRSSKM